jgi:hypothetical protein
MRKRWNLIAGMGVALLLLPTATAAQQMGAEGVRLWSQNCGRCHNFRPAAERTDREWVTIMAHMRARANLTRSTAEEILAFLQSTNVGESTAGRDPVPAPVADAEPRVDGESPAHDAGAVPMPHGVSPPNGFPQPWYISIALLRSAEP